MKILFFHLKCDVMKSMLALFVSTGILAACSSAMAAQNATPLPSSINPAAVNIVAGTITTTTVIIVRHAEKKPRFCEEPEPTCQLSRNGEKRARTLSYMLSKSGVSVVYSTQCNRTIETVNNYASSMSIPIQFYSPAATCTSTSAEIANLANTIKTSHRGKKILVIGHAETVPQIIQALGVDTSIDIGNEYDNFLIVTIRQGGTPSYSASLLHLKYPIDDVVDNSLIGFP